MEHHFITMMSHFNTVLTVNSPQFKFITNDKPTFSFYVPNLLYSVKVWFNQIKGVPLGETETKCLCIVYADMKKALTSFSQVLDFHRGPARA